MFGDLPTAPPDLILSLTEAFEKDPNPNKVNLGVGEYKDESSETPILSCVRKAEMRLLDGESTKSYLPITGEAEYGAAVRDLLFGANHEIVSSGRATTAHTPGGTGALRVVGDFLKQACAQTRIWVSDPTWSNHLGVFGAAGLEIAKYPYYDAEAKRLDFEGMIAALKTIPQGGVVLLHGCCHNPSGMDPTPEQWREISQVVRDRNLFPLIDFAYQGLAGGIEEDTAGLRSFCEPGRELLIASSFSKNFGLYRERAGALTIAGQSAQGAEKAMSHVKIAIRANYSNPPAHGGRIVVAVLSDPELRSEWEAEVAVIRNRIHDMRRLFVETLKAKGVERDFSFVTRQNGMFSFSGLTEEQVDALRERYSIYMVRNGRINVAGMTSRNMDRICEAVADVLATI